MAQHGSWHRESPFMTTIISASASAEALAQFADYLEETR
jgi:hypothetical protein